MPRNEKQIPLHPKEQPAFSTRAAPTFLAQPCSRLKDLPAPWGVEIKNMCWNKQISPPMLWKVDTAIQSYTFNQEVPHRAKIYSIEKPLFVMLSPSSVYLNISTWTNIPTKYNRPLLSKVTYIKLWYQWSDKQEGSNLTEVLKLSHNRGFQSNKSFQSPFQINKINNYKTKMWI